MKKTTKKNSLKKKQFKTKTSRHYLFHLAMAVLGFVGVAIEALAVV